jgi:ABC-type glycerol-3-phosphate transport system substrate-binding protein
MTSDEWVKWANDLNKDPVSCNTNVQASDDPLSLKYAEECADHQFTYLDWSWPPEITRSFQENQQAIVAGTKKPDEAAQAIQEVLDDLYAEGYKFEM